MAKKKEFPDIVKDSFREGYESEPEIIQDETPAPVITPEPEAFVPEKKLEATAPNNANGLAAGYENMRRKKKETQTVRISVVAPPSIGQKLDEYYKQGKIESKNGLILFLLKQYFRDCGDPVE